MSDTVQHPDADGRSVHRTEARVTRTGVVTFLDVLGWKGIYNRETSPIMKLTALVRELQAATAVFRGTASVPEVRSISDTIVVYSTGVETADASRVIEMHGALCGRAVASSISARIPVRGATSFGEFEVQDSIYVGKAIDEAASWYEFGDWIGVHLTPSAMLEAHGTLANWIGYQPPLKQGTKYRTPCVNWLEDWRKAVPGEDPKRQLQSVFRDMGPITPDFAMKFINTLEYFDELLRLDAIRASQQAEQGGL